MHIEKFYYNSIDDLLANTYVVSDDKNKCVVIDPGKDDDGVINYLENHKLLPVAILLTHGHIDHIGGVNRLAERYRVSVYIHELDLEMLYQPRLNLSSEFGKDFKINANVVAIKDKEEFKFLNEDIIKVLHTPFHTKGSVCYYFVNNKCLFSGDTLFKESIGRDDLPNADPSKTHESLQKLKNLPKETKIYPGHGPNTTMDNELLLNNFLIF